MSGANHAARLRETAREIRVEGIGTRRRHHDEEDADDLEVAAAHIEALERVAEALDREEAERG